jgi:RNA polymerase sigma-70 factor (ECF subfamily)
VASPINDDNARTLRALWFDYLDAVEPVRSRLYAVCLQLTGSVWEAEDLVQDTLLRGFGVIGRSDDAGGQSGRWIESPGAYLSRIAANLWIDRQRRGAREVLQAEPDPGSEAPKAIITRAAGAALFDKTAPQERAAVVLTEVFDFSLAEVAELLSTTTGAVKAALHRGRRKLSQAGGPMPHRHAPAPEALIDRFIVAFNARDVAAITALLLESSSYEPLGVGGEHGTRTTWLTVSFVEGVTAERRFVQGESVVAYTFAHKGRRRLGGLVRLEEAEGRIARIINYFYCPDTLAAVATELGLEPWSNGYHQTGETLDNMIAAAKLPWPS